MVERTSVCELSLSYARPAAFIGLTRAIPERTRGGYDDALYKSTFTVLHFSIKGIQENAIYRTTDEIIDRFAATTARRLDFFVICNM